MLSLALNTYLIVQSWDELIRITFFFNPTEAEEVMCSIWGRDELQKEEVRGNHHNHRKFYCSALQVKKSKTEPTTPNNLQALSHSKCESILCGGCHLDSPISLLSFIIINIIIRMAELQRKGETERTSICRFIP